MQKWDGMGHTSKESPSNMISQQTMSPNLKEKELTHRFLVLFH